MRLVFGTMFVIGIILAPSADSALGQCVSGACGRCGPGGCGYSPSTVPSTSVQYYYPQYQYYPWPGTWRYSSPQYQYHCHGGSCLSPYGYPPQQIASPPAASYSPPYPQSSVTGAYQRPTPPPVPWPAPREGSVSRW